MSESISQGIPNIILASGIKLYKINDISFTSLKKEGFNCLKSSKKPDQIIAKGEAILVAIEDKLDVNSMQEAIEQIKNNYLPSLPNTKYYIVRAGDNSKVFFRTGSNQIVETGITLKGKEVTVFGPKVISGENKEILNALSLYYYSSAGRERTH